MLQFDSAADAPVGQDIPGGGHFVLYHFHSSHQSFLSSFRESSDIFRTFKFLCVKTTTMTNDYNNDNNNNDSNNNNNDNDNNTDN